MVAPALGIPGLAAGLSVLVTGLIVFGPVADWLGGPGTLLNPSHNLAFAALGDGKKRVHLMRMVTYISNIISYHTSVWVGQLSPF